MKRFITIMLCAIAVMGASAKHYKFYYIAHAPQSDQSTICERIVTDYDNAVESGWDIVVYLANGDSPYIARPYLANHEPNPEYDNEFNIIISQLQSHISHNVDAAYDSKKILSIFDEFPFTDQQGKLLDEYETVDLNFYINSDFWDNNEHEFLLAALLHAIEADRIYNESDFRFDVIFQRSIADNINYNPDAPLGNKYPWKLNKKFNIAAY